MDKRAIAKYLVRTATVGIVKDLVTKTLISNIPNSERFKIAEMSGGVAGMITATKTMPITDSLIDQYFDKLEAKKNTTN